MDGLVPNTVAGACDCGCWVCSTAHCSVSYKWNYFYSCRCEVVEKLCSCYR